MTFIVEVGDCKRNLFSFTISVEKSKWLLQVYGYYRMRTTLYINT
jgi:hypothetical protein